VVQFVNENFVAWGGDVRTSEGFQMSNNLKASTFPFCAVVMGSSNQRIALLQHVSLDTGVKICTSLFIQKNVLFESLGSFEAHL
jgi:hypothetical protein